jgi:hypothetical protein
LADAVICSLEAATFVTRGVCHVETAAVAAVVTVERVIVSAQAALFLLALRRRFRDDS